MKTDRIGIIGAGLMGVGIAARFAQAGYRTLLHDIAIDRLQKVPATISGILDELDEAGQFNKDETSNVLKHIEVTSDLQMFRDIDLAIEVVPESLAIKHDLYETLIPILSKDAIIASNTSGFPPDLLSVKLEARDNERFIIAHFWNPPHVFPLVEIVPGSGTSVDCIEKVRQIAEDIGCKSVVLTKAIPGFIGNRLQFAVLREALAIVQSGAASPEVVDEVMKASLGRRYSIFGPLEGADIGGLNTFLDISTHLMPDLATDQRSLEILKDHVDRGENGLGSGKGFYDWNSGRKSLLRARRVHLLRQHFQD